MSTRIVSTWYQALLPDGSVWAETSSKAEVILHGQLADKPVTYRVMSVMQYDGPWQDLIPSPAELDRAKAKAEQWRDDDDDEDES